MVSREGRVGIEGTLRKVEWARTAARRRGEGDSKEARKQDVARSICALVAIEECTHVSLLAWTRRRGEQSAGARVQTIVGVPVPFATQRRHQPIATLVRLQLC